MKFEVKKTVTIEELMEGNNNNLIITIEDGKVMCEVPDEE